ncbi:MAG: ribosome maturation factor RimP [Proteobacteria bacterium]|nr:ribosome maturation factor RimP [Pseudomonadota bacterium]
MSQETKIEELIEASLEAMGFLVVRIRLMGSNQKTLQIMIDRSDNQAVSVEDCASVSRTVSAVLDVEDPINGAYLLEVSSPGIDRPLTRETDFVRYAGFDARVELQELQDGQRRFSGRLLGCEDGVVKLMTDQGEAFLPFVTIAAAKLILTDDLVAAYENQTAASAGN